MSPRAARADAADPTTCPPTAPARAPGMESPSTTFVDGVSEVTAIAPAAAATSRASNA